VTVSKSARHARTSPSPAAEGARCETSTRKTPARNRSQLALTSSGGLHEDLIISLLFRISIRLQKSLDRCFVSFGLTSQEATALLLCAESGGMSAGRLAKAMGRDKAKITHFVNRLERAKLVLRKGYSGDRRLVTLHPTARGRQMAPQLRSIFEELRKHFLTGLLSEEIAGLGSVLSQLYDNISRLPIPSFITPYQVPRAGVAHPASRKL
jgi:DNA-binding MarR family transcriptional regulator